MTLEHEKTTDDKLAVLLHAFGETVSQESQLSASHRERLIAGILDAVENEPQAVVSVVPQKARWFETKRWAATVIVSCVFVLSLFYLNWHPTPDDGSVSVTVATPSFAEKYHDQIQVALEHEAVMGRPLAWYAEQDREIRFALLPDGLPDDTADQVSRVVFAELTIEKLHNEPDICFIMVRDTQPLELFSKDGTTLKLLLWLYPVEDNLFAYELAVNSESSSGLIRAEDVERPFDFKGSGADYRVFLRVHPS